MKHKFKFQKWKAGILILLVIAICTGGYFGLSAFFTDHSVLAEQIKTGKWNYQLSVDATGDPVDGVTAGVWNAKEGVTLYDKMEADTTITISQPTRTGYTFDHWQFNSADVKSGKNTGNSGELTYDAKTKTGSYVVQRGTKSTKQNGVDTFHDDLKAVWKKNSYNITYDLGDDTANPAVNSKDNPSTYTVTDKITLEEPTRKGYLFTGWTGTGISGKDPVKSVTFGPKETGNRTYTAHWMLDSYPLKLSFKLDEKDTNDISSAGKAIVKWVKEGEDPSKPNETEMTKSGSVQIPYNAEYWVEITANKGYACNEAGYVNVSSDSGDTVTYKKMGTDGDSHTFEFMSTPKLTLEEPAWKGTVDAGKNSNMSPGSTADKNPTVTNNSKFSGYVVMKVTMPQITAKKSDGSEYKGDMFDLDIDTANWTELNWTGVSDETSDDMKVKYYVSKKKLDPDASSTLFTKLTMKGGDNVKSVSASHVSQVNVSAALVDNDPSSSTKAKTRAQTLLNQDHAHTYTLKYMTQDLPGGSTNAYTLYEKDIKITADSSVTLTLPDITGFDKPKVSDTFNVTDNSVVKEYQYKRHAYKLTLNQAALAGSVKSMTGAGSHMYGEAVTVGVTPNEGYRFVQWSDASNAQTRTFYMGASDQTLTPVMQAIEYGISYNVGKNATADANAPQKYIVTDGITVKNPTRTGYTFKGWTDSTGKKYDVVSGSDSITIKNAKDVRTGDISLTAVWEENIHTITYHNNLHDGMNLRNGDDANPHTHGMTGKQKDNNSGTQSVSELYDAQILNNGFTWDESAVPDGSK